MLREFAFFYLMRNEPEKIGTIVPDHIAYWQKVNPQNYSGGPFSDRSGGLILFEASSIEKASELTSNDPFMVRDVIESHWLKEWMREK